MGWKYEVLASKYPYKGYVEKSKHTKTMLGLFAATVWLHLQGYDIITIEIRTCIGR